MLFFESGELHQFLPEGLAFWNAVVFWLAVFGLVAPFMGPLETSETVPCTATIVWYAACGVMIGGGYRGAGTSHGGDHRSTLHHEEENKIARRDT
jgi:hypothetical protein